MKNSGEVVLSSGDLLVEILIRLPVKSLLKFKLVSKQWLSHISDPQFCQAHTTHHFQKNPHPSPSALLINKDYIPSPHFHIIPLVNSRVFCVPDLDYLNEPYVKILQSCNGLLLCSSGCYLRTGSIGLKEIRQQAKELGILVSDHDQGVRYFVVNPTTKTFVPITLPNQQFQDTTLAILLAYEPSKSSHFKLVAIRQYEELQDEALANHCRVDVCVYSSETKTWNDTRISFNIPSDIENYFRISREVSSIHWYGGSWSWEISTGIFSKGAIHWHVGESVLIFDVDEERLKSIPDPFAGNSDNWYHQYIAYYGESRGHFYIILLQDSDFMKFYVMELEEDYSHWSTKYNVDLNAVETAFPDLSWNSNEDWFAPFLILCVVRGEKEEDTAIILHIDSKAISYNLWHHSLEVLCELEADAAVNYKPGQVFQYFESLSCV